MAPIAFRRTWARPWTSGSPTILGPLTLIAVTACQSVPPEVSSGTSGISQVAGSWKFSQETASYMKLRFKDSPNDDSMIYDKSDRSLMLPTKLELPNSSGILPTYFHRRR